MKKIAANEKNNKSKKHAEVVEPILSLEEGEDGSEETTPVDAELDPEILKVIASKPRKAKAVVDTTDYVPELEREDVDFGSGSRDF